MTRNNGVGQLADRTAINTLLRAVPPTLVEEVIDEARAAELRTRRLPASLVVYFTLALWLWANEDYETVLGRLADGLAWAGDKGVDSHIAVVISRASSIARARDRLGPEPLQILFRRLSPLPAVPAPVGGSWRGLAVRSLDHAVVRVPESCGFTSARVEMLADCAGALLAATWVPTPVPTDDPHGRLTRPLRHAMPAGTLVLAGAARQTLWQQLQQTGAHLVAQAPPEATGHHTLADGSYLTDLRETRVRIIPGPHGGPDLATTLTDPAAAPAPDLAQLHVGRWRTDALTRRITGHTTPRLRSVTGFGADQELWALLCLYQALKQPARASSHEHDSRQPAASYPEAGGTA